MSLGKITRWVLRGLKHQHKVTVLIVLYDFTLANKHAVGTLHDLARTEGLEMSLKPILPVAIHQAGGS